MNRAFVALEIKAVASDDARLIEGWASLPDIDRVGDIVVPRGAIYTLPLPFLLDHNHNQAVGEVDRVEVTDKGIKFWAHIKKISEPGEVKDLCDKAWMLVKNGLRKVVSIGFSPREYEVLPSGGYKFTSWEWFELSAVTIAAAPGAQITSIKSFEPGMKLSTVCPPELPPNPNPAPPAASGRKAFAVVRLNPPASGLLNSKKPMEGVMKISEKIERFESKRAANMARIAAIHEETDESLSDTQLDEIKGLEAECDTIDRDLPSLRRAETALAKTATPVRTATIGDNGGPTFSSVTVKAPEKLEPGVLWTRLVKSRMAARLAGDAPLATAQRMYGRESEVAAIITKANEVVAGTTLSGNWAYDLVSQEGAALAMFLEYLRPATILGKFGTNGVPSLTRIDFYTPYVTETLGGAAYWVGEGKPKPLTAFDYDRSTLTPLKIANIAVLTEENIRYSTPNSDVIVRNALVKAIVAGIDVAFVDPSNNGTANSKPASITYQAATYASSATTDADAIRAEIRGLFQAFIDENNPPMSGVWIMSATNALALSMMMNTLGQSEFPGIGMQGGTLQGLPVIVSQNISDVVALVNAGDILLGDEGGVAVDMSREASIEMRSSGLGMDATAGTATVGSVSMFQTNSVALRAERTINWKRARASAVAYLSSVTWGGTAPAVS